MVRCLLACPANAFLKWHGCPFVGRLLTPDSSFRKCHIWHPYTALDNLAYVNWNPGAFKNLLFQHAKYAEETKWVCAPDVVGDAKATLIRFEEWYPILTHLKYPIAYVLQDGQEEDSIPWDRITALFLGGTTEFKLSKEAYSLTEEGKRRKKLIHIGRVNSIKRIEYFLPIMDSFDGLSFSFYSLARLPPVLTLLEREHARTQT